MKNLKTILTLSVVFIGLAFFRTAGAATIDSEEQKMVDLINDYRKSLNKTELKISKNVTNGSEFFAQDFADHPDNSDVQIHIDTTGNAPEERGQKYGYYFLSENMGWGYETAQDMFDAWKASEGHNENMITSGARTIGISRVYKAGATKDGKSVEWFWIMDMSDEGVERLIGNNLKTSEMYNSSDYRKLSVTIKKWSKSQKKYKNGKWSEVKVYDKKTGQLLDHDIGDKKGKATVYVYGKTRDIVIKAAKFKDNKTSKFTLKGKLTSKGQVKSKTTTVKKNLKFEIRLK